MNAKTQDEMKHAIDNYLDLLKLDAKVIPE